MRGRVFRGNPESMAAYQPFVGARSLQNKGVPVGPKSHLADLMFFHPFQLPNETVTIVVDGEKGVGKSVFAKSMIMRCSTLQARNTKMQLEKWRTRITSRRSEQGVAEYEAVAKFLHATVFKLGKGNRINLLGLLDNPTDVINASVNIVQQIGQRWNDVRIGPAITIAVYKLFKESPDLVGELMISEVLRGLTLVDFENYRKTTRDLAMANFKDEFEANPLLRSQLNLDYDVTSVDESFVDAAVHAADCFDVLMGSEYGDVFGGKVSLRHVLMQRVVMLDTELIPEIANTVLESVIMKAEATAIQYSEETAGTDKDMTRLIPHLNISDEEGIATKSLMHVRFSVNFEAMARAFATSRWRLYQYNTQRFQAGSADSELRGLAQELDKGVGARFIFRQSDDTDVLERFSRLGLSDQLVEQLPYLEQGEAVLFVKDRPPVRFHHRLVEQEKPLVESNFSRKRVSSTQPIYEMEDYRQHRDQFVRAMDE
jgi:hypothetical protein